MPRGKFRGGNRGRGRGRGGGRGNSRGGGGGQRQYQDNRQSFDQIDKRNEKLERLYNTINIVPEGPERDAFWAALRRELPNSFRFTGSKGHALSVRDNLVNRYFPLIKKIVHEGQPVKLPTQMPWYPEGLAYRMDTPKNVIRKYDSFKEFQKFLVSETGVGNISRQEEVSMIPPLLLDVQPHHSVLDLCAAPGSKSAQLIELIHTGEEERVERAIAQAKGQKPTNGVAISDKYMEDGGRATGMLVANDANYQRGQMLVHQVKRLNSPNLIVTNHDATMFPSIELPKVPGKHQNQYLKFDRILADVPCSGDGTVRKNPGIWREWTPVNALGLYQTQVRILTRALQMLKLGGRVVYSTCSMNPVENEAVIASAIERCGGVAKVKLLDCSDQLPGLHRKPGLKDWSIMSRSGQIYESWPEAQQFESEDSRVMPGMFPPETEEQIPLENCWRVFPHQQDTGGFFIAALEKVGDLKAKPEHQSKSGDKSWSPSLLAPAQPETTTADSAQLDQPNVVEDAPPTAFDDLLDEVANVPTDEATTVPDLPNGSTTAAQRQNEALNSPGTKRRAQDDDEAQEKKSKLNNGQPLKRKDDPTKEEAFKYLAPDHPELESIYKYYELHPSFPRDRFLVRNPAGDPVKGIYYTSQMVKDLLVVNEGRGMKFVHGGVKMFMKQDAQGQDICRWRIQTEGLLIIEGWLSDKRVVVLRKKSTLRKLLLEMFPKVTTWKHEDGTESGGWMDLAEIGEQVRDMGMGCCILRAEPSGGDDGFAEPITLPLWRSMASVNLMLPKEDRKAMLLRLFNEEAELINHSDPKQQNDIKGSIPAEEDAKELKAKADRMDETDAADSVKPDVEVTTEADRVAIEDSVMRSRDEIESKRLEVLEDEDRKIAEAMPEREGEGDDYNTTV